MDQKKQREAQRSPEQRKAVIRLLQVAENKHYREDWREGQKLHLQPSSRMRNRIFSKREEKAKDASSIEPRSLQKRHEKERLQQLIRQKINNQEELLFEKAKEVNLDKRLQQIANKGLISERLQSFHSNMTFYRSQRNPGMNIVNSSLTFYGKRQNNEQKIQNKQESRYPKIYQQSRPQIEQKMDRSIVYFRPNKSQTIRELLNQMRISKERSNHILLNSTRHDNSLEYQQFNNSKCFNQQELRQLSRYKQSLSFQEDEAILGKNRSRENIWKKKFKQSWQRKKLEMEGKKAYLKRLIVKD